jgi:hypothetical protein
MSHSETDEDRPRSEDPLPEDVSNQNREEPSAPHPSAQGGSGSGEEADTSHPPDSERSSQSKPGTPGGAGESSQATGNPDNAG